MSDTKLMGVLLNKQNEEGTYLPEVHTFVFDPKTETPQDAVNALKSFVKKQDVKEGQYYIFDLGMVHMLKHLFDSILQNLEGPSDADTVN